jgi:hypothetical protein
MTAFQSEIASAKREEQAKPQADKIEAGASIQCPAFSTK